MLWDQPLASAVISYSPNDTPTNIRDFITVNFYRMQNIALCCGFGCVKKQAHTHCNKASLIIEH